MKKTIQFLTITLLFACGSHVKKDTQDNITSATLIKQAVENQMLNLIVKYNYNPDQKLTPWQGNMKEAAYWKDEKGENVIIISELPQYFWEEKKPELKKYVKNEGDSEVAELFAYHYIFNTDLQKWKTYWVLNDFQFSCCDIQMTYLQGTIKITDLDNNGKAESVFSYYSAGGTQPLDLNYNGKLMFHLDSVKYSIKGRIGLNRNQEDIAIKREYSRNFSKLNNLYKTYSEKMWERTIAERDSLDKIVQKQWEEK